MWFQAPTKQNSKMQTNIPCKETQYSYATFEKEFNWDEDLPTNQSNLALYSTKPGRNPGGELSLSDHINELTDNDRRAAEEWVVKQEVTFKLDSYKPNLYNDNIIRTHSRGPGHGVDNADRFVNNGDIDHLASINGTLGSSWYGVGQKNTFSAMAPFTLAMSVSQITGDSYNRIHVHLFKMWGYHRTCTLQYDYYPHGPQQGRCECRSPKKTLKSFVKMMQSTFLKTTGDIVDWIKEDGNETGMTRLMIGIRPKFKKILTDTSTLEALVRDMSLTYLHDSNFHVNICGKKVVAKLNIETLITDQRKYKCDGYDVIVGRRNARTMPSGEFLHYKEPSDVILKGPVYVLGGRILKADSSPYMQGHYCRYQTSRDLALTKSDFPRFLVPDDAMQCISFLYATRYVNHAFNSKGEPLRLERIGTDLVIIVLLKTAERCTAVKNSVKAHAVVEINTHIDQYILPEMDTFQSYHLDLYKKTQHLFLEEKRAKKDQKKKELSAKKKKKEELALQKEKKRIAANKRRLQQGAKSRVSPPGSTKNGNISSNNSRRFASSSSSSSSLPRGRIASKKSGLSPTVVIPAVVIPAAVIPAAGDKRNRVDTTGARSASLLGQMARVEPTAPRKKRAKALGSAKRIVSLDKSITVQVDLHEKIGLYEFKMQGFICGPSEEEVAGFIQTQFPAFEGSGKNCLSKS